MNSMQINCLLALGETGCITKTAQKLFVTQPTVSKNLKNLEDELGFKLIQVIGHTTNFTSQGEEFYHLMSNLNNQFQSGLNDIYNEKESQPIKICHSLLPFEKAYLPTFVNLYEKNKSRKIQLSNFYPSSPYQDNIELFFQNKADFILIQEDFFQGDNRIGFRPLLEAGYSVIISKNNPLSKKRYINFDDIKHEKIWIWDSKNSVKSVQKIETMLQKANPEINISKVNSVAGCEMYAATNKGISVVPSFSYDNKNTNVVYNFLDCNISIVYGASFLKNTTNKSYFSDIIQYLKIAVDAERQKW
ncbi:hypothetical protein FC52_GL001540 [Lactobacillus pasteurii DSM 23907 = CRBIP 24.76]|uniref:HTH-type transcriptional regulator alsr (Als operon regulatoryprotein) n=1 Tax=Lactobacillus pasteurii DSM 23907 = CRBIP 24.76 TaxID=1423790 RepID=I7KKI7_9LACO|nr:LysR family transcriptional regulator [Lactobacillus pasteurii]KRK07842.1 hypothetical protein FC52_GL001540 [Lactobacillus pasteurii DSM 23907 = CRBIP 24.76]TDG77435.1 hypothetical protein C5L33_000878 [Lactobacillus pasteurii]CCI84509.1 HTH-type transcriptional regulator alsr (Als operon regulatoryprotein) [Lactobacillus pasteurii DSM 23907 = CRBIP 24.76]